MEQRLVAIEIKLTQQEDLLESLNQTVYQQQKKIDELQAICTALASHVRTRSQQQGEARLPLDERPPHY